MKEKILYDPEQKDIFGSKPVLLFSHFVNNYAHANGEYTSVNGIPRVMRQLVKALNMKGVPVVVTAFDKDATLAHGFYSSICEKPDLIKVLPLPRLKQGMFNPWRFFTWTGLINAGIAVIRSSSSESFVFLMEVWRGQRKIDNIKVFLKFIKTGFIYTLYFLKAIFQCFRRVRKLRKDVIHSERWRYAIIPHYFLFPEALDLKTPLLAYIPDYMPHFFRGRNAFPDEAKHSEIGRNLSLRARRILTNSGFSKEYLPDTALKVPREKITSFLMPYLGKEASETSTTELDGRILEKMIGKRYIFYPTQVNPNKRLDLLIQAWHLTKNRMKQSEIYLVLTANIIPEPLLKEIKHYNLMDKLLVFPYINDTTLNWLYKHAVCLGFSSEMEGNFPTQVLEALMNECPIVCMDHPLIKSELGEDTRFLLNAPFADVEKFSELILYAMNHREEVLRQQKILKERIVDRFEFKTFAENVWKLDEIMASSNKEGECLINNVSLKEEVSK